MHYRPITWGLIGAVVVFINALFDMVGISIANLSVPMLLNELFLAL